MRLLPTPLLLTVLLGLSQCKHQDPDPIDQLPPATQTGAGTFGCLVNGQPWTPQGNDGFSNYSVSYDYTYHDGALNIATYRISDSGMKEQSIGVGSDSLRQTGTYQMKSGGRHGGSFVDSQTRCKYYSVDKDTYCRGSLTITRLDRRAGIVSGTFDFTLYKPGCDTIKVTNGRFDKRL